jgi:hypothetical protein
MKSLLVRRTGWSGRASIFRSAAATIRFRPSPKVLSMRLAPAPTGNQKCSSSASRVTAHSVPPILSESLKTTSLPSEDTPVARSSRTSMTNLVNVSAKCHRHSLRIFKSNSVPAASLNAFSILPDGNFGADRQASDELHCAVRRWHADRGQNLCVPGPIPSSTRPGVSILR